jgi:hypothetical protein
VEQLDVFVAVAALIPVARAILFTLVTGKGLGLVPDAVAAVMVCVALGGGHQGVRHAPDG